MDDVIVAPEQEPACVRVPHAASKSMVLAVRKHLQVSESLGALSEASEEQVKAAAHRVCAAAKPRASWDCL